MWIAHAFFMIQLSNLSFLSKEKPFLWSRHGWKIFLKIRQTSPGPLHTFQGAVLVDASGESLSRSEHVEQVTCPKQHATPSAALLDAVDLSHVVLNVIHTELDAAKKTW